MAVECKDCRTDQVGTKRPATYPGPRCYTHHQAKLRRDRKRAGDLRAEKTYGISPEDYRKLLEAQGGRCAICRRRIGVKVRAAIDHDHSCSECGGGGCRLCVRGLVDRRCNRVLGWFLDDPEVLRRAASYLEHPPASVVLITTTV